MELILTQCSGGSYGTPAPALNVHGLRGWGLNQCQWIQFFMTLIRNYQA